MHGPGCICACPTWHYCMLPLLAVFDRPPGNPSSACNRARDGRLQAPAAACHKCSRLVSASPPAHRLRRQAGERRRGGRGARALRAGGAARVAARAGRHRSRRRAARCRLAVRPQRVVGGRGRRRRVRLVVRLALRHWACAQCMCRRSAAGACACTRRRGQPGL